MSEIPEKKEPTLYESFGTQLSKLVPGIDPSETFSKIQRILKGRGGGFLIEDANVCLMKREGNQVVIYFSRPSSGRAQSRRMIFEVSSYKKVDENGDKTQVPTLKLINITPNLKPENAFPNTGEFTEKVEAVLKS